MSILAQTLNTLTKVLLVPAGPFQIFLDAPSETHVHCLQHAYYVLEQDGKEEVAAFFRPYDDMLTKGLLWADQGWKNVCHYFSDPQKHGVLHWPGADTECQYYFNKAIALCQQNIPKGMFFLGAALHIVQDMCVPHHAVGAVFDGHQEFERWAGTHLQHFAAKQNGIYKAYTHPSQWIRHNAEIATTYYHLVSLEKGCSEGSYFEAAGKLLPLTVYTSAGFLDFCKSFI